MALSLDDVRNKRFRLARKSGYEVAEVDDFLDQLQESFAQLIEENDNLKKQIDALGDAAGARAVAAARCGRSLPRAHPPTGAHRDRRGDDQPAKPAWRWSGSSSCRPSRPRQLVAEATADAERIRAEADAAAQKLSSDTQTEAERLEAEARERAETVRADAQSRAEPAGRRDDPAS